VIEILARVTIDEWDRFWTTFREKGHPLRERHGCQSARVYWTGGASDQVVIFLDWESRERFEAFLADPVVRETMQAGIAVGPPELTFLDPLAEPEG
jgi:quinol monooxygenase YgiN